MGDAEVKDRAHSPETARYVEKRLLESFPLAKLKATVLKIGHHGSETSSTLPFIAAVDPEIVIVSSGRSWKGMSSPKVERIEAVRLTHGYRSAARRRGKGLLGD